MDLDAQRLAFGPVASVYDANRPEWPARTAAWLVGDPAPGIRLRVVDLGAGTGKLTRTLVAAGHEVIAVDPSTEMLEVLRRRMPDVETHVGAAERIPLPDGSVDAVAAVQAWHWFRHGQAAAECARVLVAGGTLGVGWHTRNTQVGCWAELERIARRRVGDREPNPDGDPGFEFPAPFTGARSFQAEYTLRLTVDGLVGLAASWSYVQVSDDRADILRQVAELGRRVAGRGGVVTLPYTTRCYRATRG